MSRLDTTLLAMTSSNVGMFFIENDKQSECDRLPGFMYSLQLQDHALFPAIPRLVLPSEPQAKIVDPSRRKSHSHNHKHASFYSPQRHKICLPLQLITPIVHFLQPPPFHPRHPRRRPTQSLHGRIPCPPRLHYLPLHLESQRSYSRERAKSMRLVVAAADPRHLKHLFVSKTADPFLPNHL